ncbi:iron-siderophore ABC transporter substrate-binding protein [Pseudonocardia sp. KRD291]|uniref:iron-siderophore ABC transporter substrate-binding protein n=1 Tax=Pseudonocardia sp. KRD291 TaxID=2792007 RepID=UPI001C49CACE|nr:iron-siderophore ABC transporter substrate-binding protein [Pseudonocardia sp. KRD291]MBW0105067.1 iron-siderophore ABC transporter substrate-binding protein [Pseudonocardia sp. KRD291]
MSASLNRRSVLWGAGALGLGALVSGCSSSPSGSADPAGGAAARTIAHKFGSTEISGIPQRVVTVGLTDQDYLLALGTVPVGVRDWFGDQPGGLWPWAREKAGGAVPAVLPIETLNVEQIAALRPDLVVGPSSGLTRAEYDALSGIAPTVAQPAEFADYGAPWQKITEMVGAALGVPDRAAGLVRDIEARFAQVREANPGFAGRTGLLATVLEDGSYYAYAEGPAPGFLVDLGLTLPPATAGVFTGPERAPVALSRERLSLLEADVLLVGLYGARAAGQIAADPVVQNLQVAREGRIVTMPELGELNGALSFGSVLSLPVALELAPPRVAAALDGNPATG